MAKTVSDEVIVAALMSNGTVKDAAAAVGLSERTIYERMTYGDFQELYKSVKADIVRKAVFQLNKQIGSAVETVTEIMTDKSINPAIRLQAAQTILTNANRFAERLINDEKQVDDVVEANAWHLV